MSRPESGGGLEGEVDGLRAGIVSAYHTGRGSVVMRGKVEIEEIRKDREAIVVTEIPFQVNKARMIERIAELVREKQIEGIGDLRDESDRDGVRVVVEIKRVGTIDAVEQLSRYLERIRLDPSRADCRGILAAQQLKPQAVTLAEARGIRCAEVDLAVLRGEREPELTLFA